MRNRGSILRYVTACLICCVFVFYSCFGFLTSPAAASVSFFENSGQLKTTEQKSGDGQNSEPEKTSEISSQGEAQQTASSESAEPAASSGTVKGKIIEKTISPYAAPLSYNNTYVKNSAGVDISIKNLLDEQLSFEINESDEPQVLIMHTHTTETFMTEDSDTYTTSFSSRTRDNNYNMVKIGETVAKKLNDAGIKTLHDTTQHDYPEYTGSYTRSAKTVKAYLEKYPSIKIVLDLHRDAVTSGETDKVKLATEINGKKAAQVMLVMGAEAGSVTDFPYWQENLKLALRLQQMMEVKYPTLARPLSLVARNYNQSLTKGSMLIEFGTDANTLDEAVYSAELVGNCLAELLKNI